jgi:cell division septum initiation protein DivIVA
VDTTPRSLRTRLLGFDKTQVRALLSSLLAEHEQAHAEIEALRRQLNSVQSDPGTASTSQSVSRFNEAAAHADRILASTRRVADEIRQDAEREAGRLVRDAEIRAARIIQDTADEVARRSVAAARRLRETEQEIERMAASHREIRSELESAATTVSAVLAGVNASSASTPTAHAEVAGRQGEPTAHEEALAPKLEGSGHDFLELRGPSADRSIAADVDSWDLGATAHDQRETLKPVDIDLNLERH